MSAKKTAKKNAAKPAPQKKQSKAAETKPTKPVKEKPVESEPKPEKPTGKGRHVRIFGYSACAVAKALGKAGIKYSEADAIMRAHGIEMPKASLSVQLGFGRNPKAWERHGEPAPLDAGQIESLRRALLP
jgi:hypothetical protein